MVTLTAIITMTPTCGNPNEGGPKSFRIGLYDCIVAIEDGEGMFPVKRVNNNTNHSLYETTNYDLH